MKVLVIPSLFPITEQDIKGIFIIDYVKCIQKSCDVSILDIRLDAKDHSYEDLELFGLKVFRFNVKKSSKKAFTYLSFFSQFKKIAASLGQESFDLVHVHGSVFHGYFAKWYAQKKGIPYVVTEHTGPFSKISGKKLFKGIAKRVIEESACLLSVSKDLENQIVDSGINPQRAEVSFNPVDTDLFQLSSKARKKQFIFAGRLEDYKGALRVLKAFKGLLSKLPEWGLTIIGDGPEMPQLKAFVAENNLEGKVDLVGQKTKSGISELFQEASIFVYPSLHETFGLVIAEAMSTGLPIIAGTLTAPPEIVQAHQGKLVDPDSIQAIQDGMLEMAQNLGNYDALKIRNTVVQEYGFEQFGNRMITLYKDLI